MTGEKVKQKSVQTASLFLFYRRKQSVNEFELIYLPLYHSKYKNVAEMLEQVAELAPLISESKKANEKIIIMSALLANKFISAEYSDLAVDEVEKIKDNLVNS